MMTAAGMAGCITDEQYGGGSERDDRATLFTIEMPAERAVATRANAGENRIDTLVVLVCDSDGTFMAARPVEMIDDGDGNPATLRAKAQIDFRAEPYDLLFVANPIEVAKLADLTPGMSRADIRKTLQQTRTEVWNESAGESTSAGMDRAVPMFGELTNRTINKNIALLWGKCMLCSRLRVSCGPACWC